ncbi:hypothetical protein [Acidovorax sp. SDU_ACID1]|uniref:hypothetical protein n=1 Tax=Acidovorax sp. SDU_ACID1 TaxID=3136632 RepID=UPI0038739C26
MTCQPATFNHTRGASFQVLTRIPSRFADGYFVGWDVKAQARTEKGALLATLEATWEDPDTTRVLALRCLDTSGWEVGPASFDVRMTAPDGFVLYTTPFRFHVVKGVTADA